MVGIRDDVRMGELLEVTKLAEDLEGELAAVVVDAELVGLAVWDEIAISLKALAIASANIEEAYI